MKHNLVTEKNDIFSNIEISLFDLQKKGETRKMQNYPSALTNMPCTPAGDYHKQIFYQPEPLKPVQTKISLQISTVGTRSALLGILIVNCQKSYKPDQF